MVCAVDHMVTLVKSLIYLFLDPLEPGPGLRTTWPAQQGWPQGSEWGRRVSGSSMQPGAGRPEVPELVPAPQPRVRRAVQMLPLSTKPRAEWPWQVEDDQLILAPSRGYTVASGVTSGLQRSYSLSHLCALLAYSGQPCMGVLPGNASGCQPGTLWTHSSHTHCSPSYCLAQKT